MEIYSRHHPWLALLLGLTLPLVLAGCTLYKGAATLEAVMLPPEGVYVDVAWLEQGVVVEYLSSGITNRWNSQFWLMTPAGSAIQPLPLPDTPNCQRQTHDAPTRLPDGRLGYIQVCIPRGEQKEILHMLAYDLQTGEATPLLSYPLPSSQIGTGGFSWNPDMTKGITADGRGRDLQEQMYWFTPEAWTPLDVGMTKAFGASWSPNGQWIAYLGAPEQGLRGLDRTESLLTVYLMRPDEPEGKVLVEGFRSSNNVAWSPDSRWLAFPGTFGTGVKEEGIWLVEMASGKRQLAVPGKFGQVVWSPDGQHLAAIRFAGEFLHERWEVVIVNVSSLVD